jgi:hypothetical protein
MTKWQLIETAPADTCVEMGRWIKSWGDNGPQWVTQTGVARVRHWTGMVCLTPDGQRYSHWAHLPPPPPETPVHGESGE